MNTYRIVNTVSGLVIGTYTADSKEEALDAMARDASYTDYATLCKVAPAAKGEIVVTEV